ncbi:MAG: acyl-CoA thioesterase [Planctomycetes bacterium]|nr:acyl-CoA thioesterase [Planctomycetota bacterium]
MHFSTFFVYMEQAEHELLRSVGLSVLEHDDEGILSWPRVSASCDYRRPLRFEDEFEIETRIERLGEKSITFACRFLHEGQEAAAGRLTAVCCRFPEGRPPQSIPIPPRIADELRRYVDNG